MAVSVPKGKYFDAVANQIAFYSEQSSEPKPGHQNNLVCTLELT